MERSKRIRHCPKCKSNIFRNGKGLFCNNLNCSFCILDITDKCKDTRQEEVEQIAHKITEEIFKEIS